MGRRHTEALAKKPTGSIMDRDHNQEENSGPALASSSAGAQRRVWLPQEEQPRKIQSMSHNSYAEEGIQSKQKALKVCMCVWLGGDFFHPQWIMTREEEKAFLQYSRFLKLRFVTPTYIGHLQKWKALGWVLYTLQGWSKLSSSGGADNMMRQEQERRPALEGRSLFLLQCAKLKEQPWI